MVAEVVAELDYLRIREQKLRDTNESTNERVKWFAFGTMGMLVGLGAWQIVYLRAYFRFVAGLRFNVIASLHNYTDPSTSSRRDGRYNAIHVIQVGEVQLYRLQQCFIGTVSAITASLPFHIFAPIVSSSGQS